MTVTEITTLLSALAAFVTSMAGVYVSIRNGQKVDTTVQKLDENTAITKETHAAVDAAAKPNGDKV
jgi:hypothetical protein